MQVSDILMIQKSLCNKYYTDKASIDGVEGGKTPAAQQCGLENPSTKVPEGASCR